MENDVPAVSGLAPAIPNIIITQPSPKRDQEGRVPRTPFSNRTAGDPPSPAAEIESPQSSTSENEADVRIPFSTSFTASEGFVPVDDCTEVKVEDSCTEVNVEQDDRKPPTPPHSAVSGNVTLDVPIGRSFRDRLRCCSCPEDWNDPAGLKWKLICTFQLFLLGIFIAATIIGGFYVGKCPLKPEVPYFIFMIGVAGCMVLVCRLVMITCCSDEYISLWIISVCGTVIILLLFFAELTPWSMSPSFHHGDSNYCAEHFYNITFWFDRFGLSLLSLLCLFYVLKLVQTVS